MPSSNIDSWAGVRETRPVSVTGHWKWPFSNRLLNRQRPCPSNQSSLTNPPRLPRKANKAPLKGSAANTCWVAEQLGLKWEVVAHLVRRGLIHATPGEIASTEVAQFRKEYVLGSELAKSAGTSPRHVAIRLSALRIFAVVGPAVDGSRQNIYRRRDVEELIPGSSKDPCQRFVG
jgi:hypothetical protein